MYIDLNDVYMYWISTLIYVTVAFYPLAKVLEGIL